MIQPIFWLHPHSTTITHGATCCWLGCTIPFLLPSNSSILSLQLLPLLPSLTCARVRGNRHQGKSLTIFHMDWLNSKIPIENMDNLCDFFGWKKFQNNFQNYLRFFSLNGGYCEIFVAVVKLTYLRYKWRYHYYEPEKFHLNVYGRSLSFDPAWNRTGSIITIWRTLYLSNQESSKFEIKTKRFACS